jgi:magnesium chelatase subunit D
MAKIIPQYIRRIQGSEYNIDPEGKYGMDSFLLQQLKESKDKFDELPTELVPSPFVQIPLGCMEDSLIGTVDLEQSLDTGVAKFSPGLLAKSHRG